MQQLTSLDALFLAHEGDHTIGHVCALAVLDPTDAPGGKVTFEDLRAMVQARLPLLPPFRRKLAEVPFGLDHAYWVTDPDFDLDYHLRESALPPPGGRKQLERIVGRLYSQPLDRRRPLWEMVLIQGLKDGRCVLMTKIHHALVDGVSGAEVLGALLDLSPEGRDEPEAEVEPAEEPPSPLQMLVRGATSAPRRTLERARALPTVAMSATSLPGAGWIPGARTVGRVAQRVLGPIVGDELRHLHPSSGSAPRTPFSGRISGHLDLAHVRLDLDEVKAVKNALEVTVNDVITAVATGGTRHWLLEHDALPDEPLLALVPISLRTEEQVGTFGNRVSAMVVPLPTNLETPRERVAAVHASMRGAKDRQKRVPAEAMVDATRFMPPALYSQAAKLTLGIAGSAGVRPPMNMVVSNVPGPQVTLYCVGAKVETIVPVSIVTHGVGLNITVMSYCGRVDAGIVVDREQIPDPWVIGDGMQQELEALKELADAAS